MKIPIVLGPKAQLVKMAPVMVRLRERDVPYRFIHTGQHQATMSEMESRPSKFASPRTNSTSAEARRDTPSSRTQSTVNRPVQATEDSPP